LTAVFLVLVVFLAAILAMLASVVVKRARRGVSRDDDDVARRADYSRRGTAPRVFAGACSAMCVIFIGFNYVLYKLWMHIKNVCRCAGNRKIPFSRHALSRVLFSGGFFHRFW
jgi:hypothetical protein